ncbi:MAG: DUF4340 domain-containing protein [Verrucomicrobia bacterium]|nr:DUF4340 domain-containing protein [Verrucomicrobiota bacterium]
MLALIAAVLSGAVVLSKRQPSMPSASVLGQPLLPELPLNDLTSVKLESANASATLTRADGQWVVEEQYGYPADFEKLRRALLSLTDLKIADVLTVIAEQRVQLGLQGPLADHPVARHVRLTAGEHIVADLRLGDFRNRQTTPGNSRPDGRYVMLSQTDAVMVVGDLLNLLSDQPANWLDTSLLNVARDDLTSLTITGSDRAPIALTRTDDGLTLTDLDDDEELDPGALATLLNAFAYLNFQSIANPSLSDIDMGLEDPIVIDAETASLRIQAQLGGPAEGSTRYLRLHVDRQSTDDASDMPGTADSFDHFDDWTYVIADYKAEAFATTRAALVKAREKSEMTVDGEGD